MLPPIPLLAQGVTFPPTLLIAQGNAAPLCPARQGNATLLALILLAWRLPGGTGKSLFPAAIDREVPLSSPGQEANLLGSPSAAYREEVVKRHGQVIRLKRIYNFLCSMLIYTLFSLCFDTLRGVFMHFLELTY
jgi:hypothetical protein